MLGKYKDKGKIIALFQNDFLCRSDKNVILIFFMLSSDNDKNDESLNNKLENLCFIYLFKQSKSNKVLYIYFIFFHL
jgi:hypothetical protein